MSFLLSFLINCYAIFPSWSLVFQKALTIMFINIIFVLVNGYLGAPVLAEMVV